MIITLEGLAGGVGSGAVSVVVVAVAVVSSVFVSSPDPQEDSNINMLVANVDAKNLTCFIFKEFKILGIKNQ